MLGIARPDLHQVTILAGDVMDLEDLGICGQCLRDMVVGRPFSTPNSYKGEHPLLNGARIDLGDVPADDASRLELADALEHSRGSHPDGASDFGLGLPGIFLKDSQDPKVLIVDYSVILRHTELYDAQPTANVSNLLLDRW